MALPCMSAWMSQTSMDANEYDLLQFTNNPVNMGKLSISYDQVTKWPATGGCLEARVFCSISHPSSTFGFTPRMLISLL